MRYFVSSIEAHEKPSLAILAIFNAKHMSDCSSCTRPPRLGIVAASAKNISVGPECLRQSGPAPSEPSETPRWRITPCPASIPHVALHISLRSPFCRFFSLCLSPILNKQSGVVANCDHMLEWVHRLHPCIGIAMKWVTLRKSLLPFLLH